MKVFWGSPGTFSGLSLRLGQCLCAGSSIGFMVSAIGFSNYTAFCYLIASMGLQSIWSLGLAGLDIHALRLKRDLHNPVLVSLFVVGDWFDATCFTAHPSLVYLVTAILSFAAACSSAGVTVLFAKDVNFCNSPRLQCNMYAISIVCAFITWLLIAASSVIMFLLLASV